MFRQMSSVSDINKIITETSSSEENVNNIGATAFATFFSILQENNICYDTKNTARLDDIKQYIDSQESLEDDTVHLQDVAKHNTTWNYIPIILYRFSRGISINWKSKTQNSRK